MGGIGRALAVRLVESGARNLVFLSRSGATTPAAIDLIKLLQHAGATAKVLKCDVGNIRQLETAVKEISQHLPAIKGMFHLGMVMRSALFENMSLGDWTDSLLPKVQGTWNLHNLLPKDLDFFVLISSFVGIV
jgi:NAD(P)-dependent dehydrogenase (short-subunit alcohol dehydrogenase family)